MARLTAEALYVSATDGSHELRAVTDPDVLGPIDFAWRDRAASSATVFGAGPLAGVAPGSHRLVVCGVSPIWDGFFPSTIGGAGLPWQRIGVRFMAVTGRAAAPSVLVIARVGGVLRVAVEAIDVDAAWREEGLYSLLRTVHARFAAEFPVGRVLAVGPAAARTRAGAIGSAPIVDGVITSADTWAGRGGLGSRLYREHGLCAVVFGGDGPAACASAADGRAALEGMAIARFGKPLKVVDLEETQKYRFDPQLKTGGTFGSNFHRLRERGLSFNHRSVLFSDSEREDVHERLVAGHYLAQFDRELGGLNKGHTCGEPCAARCKKVDGNFKKDFQPYQALGPLIGVFDQRAAESINRFADACGFDAIQIGGEVAWLMECLDRGWLAPRDVGATSKPRWDAAALEPVADSAHNAALGRDIIRWLLDDPGAATMRQGLRVAAESLGGEAAQAAVYNARGDAHGCLVPNQYWVPGMFAPVPILGRYYLDYDYEWQSPEELGRSSAERMVKELMLDNTGVCRFHRGWAETLVPEILNEAHGIVIDASAHHRRLARSLDSANLTLPWQTERVVDLIAAYLVKVRDDGPREPELDRWIERFAADKPAAARAYWEDIKHGFSAGLAAEPQA